MRLTFATGDGGSISKLTMKTEAALEPISFKRTPETINIIASDLEDYVGDYNLMGTTLKSILKPKRCSIFLFLGNGI